MTIEHIYLLMITMIQKMKVIHNRESSSWCVCRVIAKNNLSYNALHISYDIVLPISANY